MNAPNEKYSKIPVDATPKTSNTLKDLRRIAKRRRNQAKLYSPLALLFRLISVGIAQAFLTFIVTDSERIPRGVVPGEIAIAAWLFAIGCSAWSAREYPDSLMAYSAACSVRAEEMEIKMTDIADESGEEN